MQRDVVHLGGGGDAVDLKADGQIDLIECGDGHDDVFYAGDAVEPEDSLVSCERVLFLH